MDDMVLDILNFHQLFSISKVKQQIHNSVQQHATSLHSKSMRHNPPLLTHLTDCDAKVDVAKRTQAQTASLHCTEESIS